MDSLAGKPVSEVKQRLGEKVFRVVKELARERGVKGAVSSAFSYCLSLSLFLDGEKLMKRECNSPESPSPSSTRNPTSARWPPWRYITGRCWRRRWWALRRSSRGSRLARSNKEVRRGEGGRASLSFLLGRSQCNTLVIPRLCDSVRRERALGWVGDCGERRATQQPGRGSWSGCKPCASPLAVESFFPLCPRSLFLLLFTRSRTTTSNTA